MKCIVLSYTGTVGKTTLAANLLRPRMNDATVIAIESINESTEELGIESEKLSGQRFKELFSKLLYLDDAIVDVGASNIEAFLDGLAMYEDSHLEFDFFIIPVTPGTKEQKETISLLLTLQNYGINPDKIRIVYNRVESDVELEFDLLCRFFRKNPEYDFNPGLAIKENELFDALAIQRKSIHEILSDQTDYRQQLRDLHKSADKKDRSKLIEAYTTRSLARSVVRNLDEVFNAMFEAEAAHV
ncbi:StbB family protein [Spirochaeta dissipatitropha]